MSHYTDDDRILALAGLMQGARLTLDLARRGNTDSAAFDTSLRSLFVQNPETVPAVFGDPCGVTLGLRTLVEQLVQPRERQIEITRYVVGVLNLQRALARDAAGMDALGEGLSGLAERHERFNLTDTAQIAQIADLYQEHVSPRGPRIMVKGEPLHLQNPDTAARIRTALLAAVRAAILWRQCGGRRWQLILQRSRLAAGANRLLDACP